MQTDNQLQETFGPYAEELRIPRLLLLELMGQEEGEAFFQDALGKTALLTIAPQTFMAQMVAKIQSIYASIPEEELERRSVRLFPLLMTYKQQRIRLKVKEIMAHPHPGPRAVMALLSVADSSSNKNEIRAELKRRPDVDISIIGGNPTGGMVLAAQNGVVLPFETRANALASMFVSLAEKLYRPLLVSLLRVTLLLEGSTKTVLDEETVGSVIYKCKEAWKDKYKGLLVLLDDRARVLRNSQGHCSTEIDVIKETISFINKNAAPFGPLTIEEFVGFFQEFVQFNMSVVDVIRLYLDE